MTSKLSDKNGNRLQLAIRNNNYILLFSNAQITLENYSIYATHRDDINTHMSM